MTEEEREEKKSPAPGGIFTLDLVITRRALNDCSHYSGTRCVLVVVLGLAEVLVLLEVVIVDEKQDKNLLYFFKTLFLIVVNYIGRSGLFFVV